MGGEKPVAMHSLTTKAGSPPRGRGKGWQTFWPCAAQGDHPRMGGEKISICAVWLDLLGSPPHGRGKGVQHSRVKLQRRITPAWAGKSPGRCCLLSAAQDHPRMGGEKRMRRQESQSVLGSPPHGRGKGPVHRPRNQATRITPAWAGKRPPPSDGNPATGDHPRMGGEKPLKA